MQLFFSLCCGDNREQIRDWQKDRDRPTEIRGREGGRGASGHEEVGGSRSDFRWHHQKTKKTKKKHHFISTLNSVEQKQHGRHATK